MRKRGIKAKSSLSLHFFVGGQFCPSIPLDQTTKIAKRANSLHFNLFKGINDIQYSLGHKSVKQ